MTLSIYAFSDQDIGLARPGKEDSLISRLIRRPPGLADADWTAHASEVCRLLNATVTATTTTEGCLSGLLPEVLQPGVYTWRSDSDPEVEARAKVIYDSWSDNPEFVPWVAGGNSLMQDKARRMASEEDATPWDLKGSAVSEATKVKPFTSSPMEEFLRTRPSNAVHAKRGRTGVSPNKKWPH